MKFELSGAMYTIAVKPKTPTILDGETSLKLPAYDLWTGYVRFVNGLMHWFSSNVSYRTSD